MWLQLLLFVLGLVSADRIFDDATGMELLLVQPIWRHGDRSPTKTYTSDYYQEDAWNFGGTGWGQLSPKGMSQHLNLGKKLRNRYVDGVYKGFLSPYYNSKEVYYRSTDVNRTIISAMSNMIGMWSQPSYNNRADTDYPTADGWPAGYVPIAVHTVDDDTDYIGNADAVCQRQTQLWAMAKQSDELKAFIASNQTSYVLNACNKNCGMPVDIDNLWIIADSYLIENIYYKDEMLQKNAWFTSDLNNQVVVVNDQVELYQNGVFKGQNGDGKLMMNGLDIGLEIKKIRGGSLVNDVEMHMNIKLDCLAKNKTDGECKWISGMKYYVYSAHDTTVYAFFSCLGIQSRAVTPHGYPKYSAAALMELWYDHEAQKPYFKLLYHQDDQATTDFDVITNDIDGCDRKDGLCDLDVYRKISKMVTPDQPMTQWCQVDPNTQAASGIFNSFIGLFFALLTVRLF